MEMITPEQVFIQLRNNWNNIDRTQRTKLLEYLRSNGYSIRMIAIAISKGKSTVHYYLHKPIRPRRKNPVIYPLIIPARTYEDLKYFGIDPDLYFRNAIEGIKKATREFIEKSKYY